MKYRKFNLPIYLVFMILFASTAFAQQSSESSAEDKSGSDPAAVEILEKHIAAIGGRERWKAVQTIETHSETEIFGSRRKSYRLDDKKTGRFYSFTESAAEGKIELGFDGAKVWRRAAFFKGYLPESDMQTKAVKTRRAPLYEYTEHNRRFEKLANEIISGKQYLVLKTTEADSVDREIEVRYYFDPSTFLLGQITSGTAVQQTTVYEDYRKINDKMVAFKSTIITPQFSFVTRTTDLKFDVPVDAAAFEFRDESAPSSNSTVVSSPNERKSESSPIAEKSAEGVLPENLRLETFEFVWKMINDSYWDKTFGGVDWAAVRVKYLPLVKTTVRSDEYHELLNRMVGELGRSHFKINKPSSTLGEHSRAEDLKTDGTIDLKLRWIDSQLVVFDVKEGTTAYAAGVRKGFVINKINGKSLDRIYVDYKEKNQGFQLKESITRVRAAFAQLNGEPESKVALELLDENNNLIAVEVVRKPAERPALDFRSERIAPGIGYIKFNYFFGDLLPRFQDALLKLSDTKALIIDLRGNGGGAGQLASSLANLLSASPGTLGTFIYRYESKPASYQGKEGEAYKGRVLVLVDEFTGSTSEVLAAGLQEQKLATVIGSTTAGAVLPSLITMLPTGGGLQYVVSNYQTPKGIVLEGRGVTPDIKAKPVRAALAKGRDLVLERALSYSQNDK